MKPENKLVTIIKYAMAKHNIQWLTPREMHLLRESATGKTCGECHVMSNCRKCPDITRRRISNVWRYGLKDRDFADDYTKTTAFMRARG